MDLCEVSLKYIRQIQDDCVRQTGGNLASVTLRIDDETFFEEFYFDIMKLLQQSRLIIDTGVQTVDPSLVFSPAHYQQNLL